MTQPYMLSADTVCAHTTGSATSPFGCPDDTHMKTSDYRYGYTVARTLWRAGHDIEPRIPANDYARGWNAAIRCEQLWQRAGDAAVKLAVVALIGGLIYLALLLI